MGTIGIEATAGIATRLGQLRPDVLFVDAPVSGSKGPAETRRLLILAAGPSKAEQILRRAFDAIARKAVWLGAAGQGSRMKVVVNAYMSILIEAVAEALELAGLGIHPADLADASGAGSEFQNAGKRPKVAIRRHGAPNPCGFDAIHWLP